MLLISSFFSFNLAAQAIDKAGTNPGDKITSSKIQEIIDNVNEIKEKAPTITRYTSGSGTYTVPANVKYIIVEMVGGGGGGSGGGTSSSFSVGASGTDSIFGDSLLIAERGHGGREGDIAQSGSGYTVNPPAVNIASAYGSYGQGFDMAANGGVGSTRGGSGGSSFFGGSGHGVADRAGTPARPNSGSGGGGGGTNFSSTNARGGGGGSAGGYIKAMISAENLESSYTYSIGNGGAGSSAGANGYPGGSGGSGVIIITEYYN